MRDSNKYNYSYSVRHALDGASKSLEKNLNMSNDAWHEVLKIVVTMSATLVTFASLFLPQLSILLRDKGAVLAWHLLAGLGLYVCAIMFGIVQQIERASTASKMAEQHGRQMNQMNHLLSRGIETTSATNEANDHFVIMGNIWFGTIAVLAFFAALIATALVYCISIVDIKQSTIVLIWFMYLMAVIGLLVRYMDRLMHKRIA